MDGLTLLIMSWLIIGVLCYFMLVKVGAPQLAVTTEINDGMTKAKSATFSNGSGDEYFTDWLNGLIEWLFSNMNCAPDILHAWIVAMNEAAKKISIPGKFEVLFEGFSDNNSVTRAPRITDIRMQQSHNNHLIVKSNISVPEVHLKLMSSQRIGDRLLVTNFDAKITDLHGEIELRLACIANQIYMIVCFCGRPELDIELRNRDAAPTGMVSTTIVDEMIRKCLLSAVTNLSLPEIGAGQCGRMGSNVVPSSTSTAFSTISRLITTNVDRPDVIDSVDSLPAAAPQTQTTHEMLKRMNQSTFLANHHAKAQAIPNKMRVKVIRAQRLGGDRLVNQPYVVLEMDEPAQKFQTKYGLNSSPFWDETFDFDLTSASEEILFEIYEGCSSSSSTLIEQATGYRGQHEVENDQFLGLAIVGLNEVRHCNANTLHTLKLQGRPYRNDVITGDLTAQFDFYYDPVSNSIGKNAKQTASDHQFPELVNRPKRSTYDPSDSFGAYNGHDVLSTMEAIGTTKSITQIYDSHGEQIGSADMQQQQHIITPQQQSSGMNERHEYATGQYQPRGSATTSQMQQHMIPSNSTGTTSTHHLPTETNITDVDNYPYHGYDKQEAEGLLKSKSDEMPQTQEVSENRQSRGQCKTRNEEKGAKKRDRSFFSELRERLSRRRRSKRRAKSCDLATGEMEESVSLPPSRDVSRTRFSEKSRSRYDSESCGGKSERSTKSLYRHSTLLLEIHENGQKRCYLIPPTLLDEPGATKLLRQGKKLHIYNDHTFAAVKCRSGTNCDVCSQRIGGSGFTKQAYQCRDCQTVCHKPCYYKTQSYCTASNVSKLNIMKDVDWEYLLANKQMNEFISEDGI